jgi:hypothetical protein
MPSIRSPLESRLFNAILLLLGLALVWRGVMELRSPGEAEPAAHLVVVLVDAASGRSAAQTEFLQRQYNLPAISQGDLESRDRLRKYCRQGGFVLHRYPATPEQAGRLAAALKELGVPEPVFVELRNFNEMSSLPLDGRLEAMRTDYPDAVIWVVEGPRPIEDLPTAIRRFL